MKIFKLLTWPLSMLYEGILRFRNHMYNSGFLGVTEFDIPVINVGNLAFGGTGKTPHTEYIIRLLHASYPVAVLSRGYKRKTTGYVLAQENATVLELGDEPFQIHRRFPQVPVAVCENRVLGIPQLLFDTPETQVILLDDAFQHRGVAAGLNILLTEHNRLFTRDALFPMGYLREYKSAAKRAHAVVVTKCNPQITESEMQAVRQEIQAITGPELPVYFSCIVYGKPVPYREGYSFPEKPAAIMAFAGIARPEPFFGYVQTLTEKTETLSFPDHHKYSNANLRQLIQLYESLPAGAVLLSTEKDQQKIEAAADPEQLNTLPLFYLPIEIQFLGSNREAFNQQVLKYVQQH